MVLDWVFVENEVMKVMPSLIDALFYDAPINVEPIKIDDAILLANGFENYKNTGSLRFFKRDAVKFEKIQGMLYSFTEQINGIEYVHEFQHALRLMGLHELADNFKID